MGDGGPSGYGYLGFGGSVSKSKPDMRKTALSAARSAACHLNNVARV